MIKKRILLFVFVLANIYSIQAQNSDFLVKRADKAYAALQFESAVRLYEQYFKLNPGNYNIAEKIGDCHWNLRHYKNAAMWYAKLDKSAFSNNEEVKKRVAELNAIIGNHKEAALLLNTIDGFQQRAKGFGNINKYKRDSADWAIAYLSVNTPFYREFSPLILDKKFVWSSNEPKSCGIKGLMGWDANGFSRQRYLGSVDHVVKVALADYEYYTPVNSTPVNYASHFEGADVSMRAAAVLPKQVIEKNKYGQYKALDLAGFEHTNYNIGHVTASSKSKKFYASVNIQAKTLGSTVRKIGIVEASYENEVVSNIHFLPLLSSDDNVMHPAIHHSGEYLVFSSNKVGGKGGYDLYIAKRSSDGSWSAPTLLDKINTRGNEVFPSFLPSGELYYSSDGIAGLGGLDIYKANLVDGVVKSDPEHLSYPLNSQYDDFGVSASDSVSSGYFTSDRYGTDDIFSFIYQKVYVSINGFVLDKITSVGIKDITVSLYEKEDNAIVKIDSMKTDEKGNYSFTHARPNREYFVIASNQESELLSKVELVTPGSKTTTQSPVLFIEVAKKSPIVPLIENTAQAPTESVPPTSTASKMVLDSAYFILYFNFDKYSLTYRGVAVLDKAVEFLKSNPDYGFMLLGHTDLKGDADYNLKLSKSRVNTAYVYMKAKGIDEKRFKLSYYGKSYPAKAGLTEDEGKLNRRVEFILKKR